MINIIVDWLKTHKRSNYLLLAPTCIAAENINSQTIHSALRLAEAESGFQSLAFHDPDFKNLLAEIETLIIDEISMVSAQLFTFIRNLFAYIHQNNLAFCGINVLAVRDLAQLPPVKGSQVFHSNIWHLFYALFLHHPKRQNEDAQFYNMLQEIPLGNITQTTWNKLMKCTSQYSTSHPLQTLTTTHIVSYREMAKQINRTICNNIPINDNSFLLSEAIDFLQGKPISSTNHKQSSNIKQIYLQQSVFSKLPVLCF